MTPLEESLLIKFIKEGLTTSLTRDGEIIFEGKRHKFGGDNIEQAMEKIAKTIIDQQQDILALQYKENDPIFVKSYVGGMKQAAADDKEVKSVVDKRPSLKTDSWLLTTLRSLIDPLSSIILLEKRNAFGDHFILRLDDKKIFRFYPNDIPQLEKIFGCYRWGQVYKGIVKELTEEMGQKLFESKNTQDIDEIEKIEGRKLFDTPYQIYFQQELLEKGHEDRNQKIETELANKLNNNRKLLEEKLKDPKLNLKPNDPEDEKKRQKIREYYEGFVSTFAAVYTSSQAIVDGKLSIDDGTDYFSIINLFIQFKSLDPFGIGSILAWGLNGIRSHFKTIPIINDANFVKAIAVDAVELSGLAGETVLALILDSANRQRIFDAQPIQPVDNFRNKIKNFGLKLFEKLEEKVKKITKMDNLFLEKIKTEPAFQLGEDDANKVIKVGFNKKRLNPDLGKDLKDKQEIFIRVISVAPVNPVNPVNLVKVVNTPQPNKPTKKKCPKCNMF